MHVRQVLTGIGLHSFVFGKGEIMSIALARLCEREALYSYLVAHHLSPLSYCQFPKVAV